jgi:hypothetical protein
MKEVTMPLLQAMVEKCAVAGMVLVEDYLWQQRLLARF